MKEKKQTLNTSNPSPKCVSYMLKQRNKKERKRVKRKKMKDKECGDSSYVRGGFFVKNPPFGLSFDVRRLPVEIFSVFRFDRRVRGTE